MTVPMEKYLFHLPMFKFNQMWEKSSLAVGNARMSKRYYTGLYMAPLAVQSSNIFSPNTVIHSCRIKTLCSVHGGPMGGGGGVRESHIVVSSVEHG